MHPAAIIFKYKIIKSLNIVMKKTYISPETIVVRLMPVTIIATSLPKSDDEVETELTKEHYSDNSSAGGKNVWDEEW